MQGMQTLQTLTSLEVGQMGQQGGLPMLKGQQLQQHGQVAGGSMPMPTTIMGAKPFFDTEKTMQSQRGDFGMSVEDVLTIVMSKKDLLLHSESIER